MRMLIPFLVLLLCGPCAAGPAAIVTEIPVPWPDTRPRDPFVGPDGAVWFVGQTGDYAARFEPEGRSFRRFDLEPGTGPHNVIVADDGAVWYAGNRTGHIGRLDPASGVIRRVTMPDARAADPHTLVFGAGGDIWFTVQQGNFVGRLDPHSLAVDLIEVHTEAARPYGIAAAPDGRLWVALLGTHRLARVDPGTATLEEIELPRASARPRRVAVTSDGAVWYVDFAGGYLGRYRPDTQSVREWLAPAGAGAHPYALAADDRDRLWLVETGRHPNRLVGFDPSRETFFSVTPIPSGAGAVRHMIFDAAARTLWFGTDAGTLGHARVP